MMADELSKPAKRGKGATQAEAIVERIKDEALKGNYKFCELALRVMGMKDDNSIDDVPPLEIHFVSSGVVPASSEREQRERYGLPLYD